TRQTSSANSIATDKLNNVFAVVDRDGSSFLTKYNSDGFVTWTRSIDTPVVEQVADVVVDANGNAYIAGLTQGDLAGPNNGNGDGSYDGFVINYDPAGNVLWTRQIGSPGVEFTESITMDGSGNLYIAGVSDAKFATSNTDGDTFIVKYSSSGD